VDYTYNTTVERVVAECTEFVSRWLTVTF